jgi:hypothetical protein
MVFSLALTAGEHTTQGRDALDRSSVSAHEPRNEGNYGASPSSATAAYIATPTPSAPSSSRMRGEWSGATSAGLTSGGMVPRIASAPGTRSSSTALGPLLRLQVLASLGAGYEAALLQDVERRGQSAFLLGPTGAVLEIGLAMGLSPATVKTMLQRLYQRTGTAGRMELVRWRRAER